MSDDIKFLVISIQGTPQHQEQNHKKINKIIMRNQILNKTIETKPI